jgi:hypothetical protein
MTLTSKTENTTAFVIERKRQVAETIANGNEKDVHVAGGDHKGIVINKLINGKPRRWVALALAFLLLTPSRRFFSQRRQRWQASALVPAVQSVPGQCPKWQARAGAENVELLVHR